MHIHTPTKRCADHEYDMTGDEAFYMMRALCLCQQKFSTLRLPSTLFYSYEVVVDENMFLGR